MVTPAWTVATVIAVACVQCSGCGTPIGVLDPAARPLLDTLKNQIAAIEDRLTRIAKALTN